jgi:ABC-type branched-subunit amino acid transport system permease subunit
VGINVNKFKLLFFTLSAFYGGTAGSLLAHYLRFLDPQSFTIVFSVNLLFMCSIAGSGYLWGGIAGALFITLFPEGLSLLAKISFLPNAPGLRTPAGEDSYGRALCGFVEGRRSI